MLRQHIFIMFLCIYGISRVNASLTGCSSWGYASYSDHTKIRLDEPFGIQCKVETSLDLYHLITGSKNCILTHRDSITNEIITCISNENATPCSADPRIIIENRVHTYTFVEKEGGQQGRDYYATTTDMVSCLVIIQNAKLGDVGTWTLTQTRTGYNSRPSVRATHISGFQKIVPWTQEPSYTLIIAILFCYFFTG